MSPDFASMPIFTCNDPEFQRKQGLIELRMEIWKREMLEGNAMLKANVTKGVYPVGKKPMMPKGKKPMKPMMPKGKK